MGHQVVWQVVVHQAGVEVVENEGGLMISGKRIILTKTDAPKAVFPVTPPLEPRVGAPLGRVQLLKERRIKKKDGKAMKKVGAHS